MERRIINFQGRVQGVGFRATAADIAKRHGVTGWVRNEADYSVHMEIQGPSAAIDAALTELRAVMARNILHEDVNPAPVDSAEIGFQTRR